MGIVRMGAPEDIILYLKELSKCEIFIETGTFKGLTSVWASKYFRIVKTIEFSEDIYKETKLQYSDVKNIDFVYGDSRNELKNILSKNNQLAIFWLDAHWCSFGSYGEDDQCPLLDELEIILTLNKNHIILIDDARLFLAPPPLPNISKFYPTIIDIMKKILEKADSYITIYEDVIISLPNLYRNDFELYMQQKTTSDELIFKRNSLRLESKLQVKRKIKKLVGFKYWRFILNK